MAIYEEPSKDIFVYSRYENMYIVEDVLSKHEINSLIVPEGVCYINIEDELVSPDSFLNPEDITLPETLTVLGKNVFSGNTNIKKYKLPNGIVCVKKFAFVYCALTSIELSNNLEEIEEAAFHTCEYLKSITIPAKCNKIGPFAFYNCHSLEEVVFEDPCGWVKCKYDSDTGAYSKKLFGGVSKSTLTDPKMAAKLLKTGVSIIKKQE